MINVKQILLMAAVVVVVLAAGIDPMASSQAAKFNFDNDSVEQPPAGFTSYATGGGPAGKWLVKEMADAPSGKHVVEQTDADRTDYRFPVLVADKGEYADLDLSVKGKAISGKIDQGIGLVFRFRDPKSYYIVRANALEDNFRLYRMVNGRRIQFAGANLKVSSGQWHTLRVVAKGTHFVCYFDGKQLIDARDSTYSSGKIGLWTKADSVIAFDDLTVSSD
ncbi:MAG TPA: family 16 glycoside hydrolase [Acidobacteriota bacterium]